VSFIIMLRISRLLAAVLLVFIANAASAAIAIDVNVSSDRSTSSTTLATPAFSTAAGNELLLAFVSADYLSGPNTSVTGITGAGLTWVRVVTTNARSGTAEIWRAFAPSLLTSVSVTATLSQSVAASITVMSFTGADPSGTSGSGAIGAIGSANAASGAPAATLVTTRNNSWVFGVGTDYDKAVARTPGTGQSLVHQYLATIGDTYWVQKQNAATPLAGTSVTINDTAPTADRYNLSICEILQAPAGPTTWRLSGTISPVAGGGGTLVQLGGMLQQTNADSSGNYAFSGVSNGTYSLTPSRYGYTFSPATQFVTVNGADISGINFTAQVDPTATWSISGTISPAASGSGASVIIGETSTVTADSSGNYRFPTMTNGTYTLVVTKSGYTFSPAAQFVTVNGANVTGVNFTDNTASGPATTGQWGAPFDIGIVAVNTVLMHTGKVLMFSGSFATSAIERVWDPATGGITLVPNPYYNLFCAGQSQLADGRILVVGGYDTSSLGAANANIFDPVTQTWSALPNMTYRRWYPTSTTLPDGRALVTSGAQSCLTCLADVPEIFDPATNRFTTVPTARLAVPYYPFMFVLPSGKVIDAGANEDAVATSALDLTARTWSTVDANVKDGHSAAMYQPGKILKSGTAADSGTAGNAAATAYVLDATQPTAAWRQVASMANRRAFHNTTLLPDGTVLVTGGGTALDGYDISKAVFAAELWSPISETWRTLAPAAIPRLYHSTALLLPDGRVLMAGSGNDGPAIDQTQAELFSPPYLFKGARPTVTGAPGVIQYGSIFTVTTPDADTIASVSLIRPGAVTHGFDEDQRFLSLSFTAGSGALSIQAPANANLAPPGYYMLFLVNTAGVPSVAPFVHFAAPGGDTIPPTPPTGLIGDGAVGSATLLWTASTDNTGVTLYNVHRATTSGFQPTASNRIGQPTATSFADTSVTAGTYFYVVTAQDVAGNVSAASNEAAVMVLADTTAPTVTLTAPANGATVSGLIAVSATASDDVRVAGVQFRVDGQALGAEDTTAPYSVTWNTASATNTSHTLTAVARDAAGNSSQAAVDVVVSNTSQTPGGLVAAYSFNENGGVQVTDASGQGNTGTISSATWTTAGKFGAALSFNGTSSWVTVADAASLDLSTGMTIEAWVNPGAGTGWRSVALKEGTNELAYALYSANNASRPAGFVHTNADVSVNGTSAVALSVWTHLALTFDGATLRMFANGVQVSTKAVAGAAVATNGALRIGGNSVWGEYFKGLIDEVRIYNRALSAAEIQTDMTTPIP
jgi:Concanavalin A-like lectin/glucanases superfamily/Galactose oxidase-like, Early set domain/Bacterial Ig domain/Kelch motif